MYLALAVYNNRIASLFETANQFVILNLPVEDLSKKKTITIRNNSISALQQLLEENQVKILICGAIHSCVAGSLEAIGIQLIPWITGEINSVVKAFQAGSLENYSMPGRCGRRRQGRLGRRGRRYF